MGSNLIALRNGTVDLTASDSSIASGAPGIDIGNTGTATNDSLVSWVGGSLPLGNATTSIFNQPNTLAKPQVFASAITSVSLATPNKTRICDIVRGDQSGSALTTGNIQPQGSLCYIDAASTVAQVVVLVDAGASTMQLATGTMDRLRPSARRLRPRASRELPIISRARMQAAHRSPSKAIA